MFPKKLLALLMAAALALSLLAGCGGSSTPSTSQVLLNLLDDKYQNVSVEMDPDLEADLRQAISTSSGTGEEAVRDTLEQLLGVRIDFSNLDNGQEGDTAMDLVFHPGTDRDAAAQDAYTQWNLVFSALPDDGQYAADLAIVETEDGFFAVVKATVNKAGQEDKPEPEPVTLESIAVTKEPTWTFYWEGESFNPEGMEITATYSDNSTKIIRDITTENNQGVTWDMVSFPAAGSFDVTISYGGKTTKLPVEVSVSFISGLMVCTQPTKLEYDPGNPFIPDGLSFWVQYTDGSEFFISGNYEAKGVTWAPEIMEPDTKEVTITYTDPDPVKGVGSATIPVTVHPGPGTTDVGYESDDYSIQGTEAQKTFLVRTTAGLKAWADYTNAKDENLNTSCILQDSVTLPEDWEPIGYNSGFVGTFDGGGHTITIEGDGQPGLFLAIGNYDGSGTVQNVNIQVNGNLQGGAVSINNSGIIRDCKVTVNGSITGSSASAYNCAGITVFNDSLGIIRDCDVIIHGTITGDTVGATVAAAGVVGSSNGSIEGCSVQGGTITGVSCIGGVVGINDGSITACYSTSTVIGSNANAGGVAAFNDGSITACYHTGNVVSEDTSHHAGGVAASSMGGTITDCYWSGTVKKGETVTNTGVDDDPDNQGANAIQITSPTDGHWDALVKAMQGKGYTLTGTWTNPQFQR